MTEKELFSLFCAAEEYTPNLLDQYERVLYHTSSNRAPRIPHVSNYLYNVGFRPEYPLGKRMAVCISHDIDLLYNSGKTAYLKDLIGNKDIPAKYFLNSLFSKVHYPQWKIDNLLEIHQEFNIRSSYYFLALNSIDQDFNFWVSEEKKSFKKLVESGNEIGLHGGHNAYGDSTYIRNEKERLESASNTKVLGYRNHYLRFLTPKTWNLLAEEGFKYDSTFGYSDMIGFRNGMCYPFQPYDLNQNKFINLTEVPLVAMDCTFFESYMRLTPSRALDLINEVLDTIEEVNGVFTLLWHNSYLQKPYEGFYKLVLSALNERDPWFCTGLELTGWWEKNDYHSKMNSILLNNLKARIQ